MKKHKPPRTKICPICLSEFVPVGNEKCCTAECKQANKINTLKAITERQKNNIKTKVCRICNKPFDTDEYHNRDTCSRECYNVAISSGNYKPEYTYTDRLGKIEADARLNGLHYADLQKAKTLAMVPRINTQL